VLLRLKIELLRKRVAQQELARALGIRASRVSRIVQGHVQPSPRERARISRVLGLPTWQIFPNIGRGRLRSKRAKTTKDAATKGGPQ
jgi:transcriptional regulator with XRE-family HTH domain